MTEWQEIDPDSIRQWTEEEIRELQARALPGHKWDCQLNVITTGERTVCTCGADSAASTSGNE